MKILKVIEKKDGSCDIEYTLTNKERLVIQKIAKVKKLTNKIINKFILKAIKNYLENEELKNA